MPENTPTPTTKSDVNKNPVDEVAEKAKQFAAHKAAPGPAIPHNMPKQEGTKEERLAKAKALNK